MKRLNEVKYKRLFEMFCFLYSKGAINFQKLIGKLGKLNRLFLSIIILLMMVGSAYAMTETNFVASVIAAEAGGEGYEGMYAVACVIQNRMEIQHKTAYQIVKQKNQFYGATAKNRLKNYADVKETADSIAKQVGKLKDSTKGALYFRRPDERLFKWCKVRTVRVNNHIFYK